MHILLRAIAVIAATQASSAMAVELVANGGFETGDFAGWTQFGSTGQTNVNAADAFTGSFGARFSPNSSGGIEQTLATVAGETYLIGFDLRHFANLLTPNNSFTASFDGNVLLSLSNVGATAWQAYSFASVATGVLTQLQFAFVDVRDAPANRYALDGVSVVAQVPEPASWALMIAGFGLVGGALRRRARVEATA